MLVCADRVNPISNSDDNTIGTHVPVWGATDLEETFLLERREDRRERVLVYRAADLNVHQHW